MNTAWINLKNMLSEGSQRKGVHILEFNLYDIPKNAKTIGAESPPGAGGEGRG